MNAVEPIAVQYKLAGCEDSDAPIRVGFRAYLGFGREIDRQLRRLGARWSHAASPWSRGMTIAQQHDLACVRR
jgi:hypothetical protein